MKKPSPSALVALALMASAPSSTAAGDGLEFYITGTCDREENLKLGLEQKDEFLANQLVVSWRNARHNLVEVCPAMFPTTSDLFSSGPELWFDTTFYEEWDDQRTVEGVIDENEEVMNTIETYARSARLTCLANGKSKGKELRKCMRRSVRGRK
jgi:hypothetical protein